jgi:hypothetical protein
VISATKAMKKEPQLIITNKPEEKYTNILNEPIFDQTYRGHEEEDKRTHEEGPSSLLKTSRRKSIKTDRRNPILISPTGRGHERDPAHHHKQPKEKYKDKLNGVTEPLLISATRDAKKEIQLIITNKPEEKYTDRLNGPTFDLTYPGHEEGDPAHHDEHG